MQRFIRVIFLSIALIYIGGMMYQLGYLVYFKMNQDKIIAAYCVNKNKPEMHCNGQCHLKEELEKSQILADDDSSENSQRRMPQIQFDFLIAVFPSEEIKAAAVADQFTELAWKHRFELITAESDSFWHPPRV